MASATDQKLQTLSDQIISASLPNSVVTLSVPLKAIKSAAAERTPLKRPHRNRPIHVASLENEIAAWDAASDEAWDSIED